jgi:hypothetical protein
MTQTWMHAKHIRFGLQALTGCCIFELPARETYP